MTYNVFGGTLNLAQSVSPKSKGFKNQMVLDGKQVTGAVARKIVCGCEIWMRDHQNS